MRVLVKLYNMIDPAADGSTIPREQTETYIKSEDYRTIIADKVALCGFTHKDRVLLQEYKNVIGPDDQVLVTGNYVGYISKIFTKEGDKYCYAYITIFDPDDFSGATRDNIINFKGLMKQGVKLPSSVVIQAMWSPSGKAERIIRIKGMDFTQNPSFKGSGTVKTMSVMASEEHAVDTKLFSANGVSSDCKVMTKAFSMGSLEVISIEDGSAKSQKNFSGLSGKKSYTRQEIVMKYGLNHPIAQATKNFTEVSDELLNKLSTIDTVEEVMKVIDDLVKDEEKDAMKEFIKKNNPTFMQVLISIPKDDPNHDQLLKESLVHYIGSIPDGVKVFSTVNSIKDRFMAMRYPRFALIKRIFDNYSYYYRSHKENFDNDDLKNLSALLKEDIRCLISLVSEEIYNGSNLSQMYQLIRFGNPIYESGIALSKIYRRLMISENVMGFIPPGIYEKWAEELAKFYNLINDYVFEPNMAMKVTTIDKLS